MLHLTLNSEGSEKDAELFINFEGDISFTVCTKTGEQFRFAMEKCEWDTFIKFIEEQMKTYSANHGPEKLP